MLILLTLLTAAYFAAVVWVAARPRSRAATAAAPTVAGRCSRRRPAPGVRGRLAARRRQFTTYVDEGFAALDAYLSEGYAA